MDNQGTQTTLGTRRSEEREKKGHHHKPDVNTSAQEGESVPFLIWHTPCYYGICVVRDRRTNKSAYKGKDDLTLEKDCNVCFQNIQNAVKYKKKNNEQG